jgi:acylphosphatase
MKKAVRLMISGTIQGIFFRMFCKENADKLGLKGYVRNLDDGDVELVLEGNSDEIEKMIEICKQGPPRARIRKIQIQEIKWQGDFKEFKILKI